MPDGGVKMLVKNKTSFMSKIVCDDELMVDRVITASQQKGAIALPSYGRSLVPYFVPGNEEPGEDDINVNTDVEALRRNGGSVLQAPLPRVARDVRLIKNFNGQDTKVEGGVLPPRNRGKPRGLDAKRPPANRGPPSSCSPLRIGINKSLVLSDDMSPTSPMDTALLRSSSSDSDSVDGEVVPKEIPVKRGTPARRRSSRQEHASSHFLSKSAPGMCYASLMEKAVEGKRAKKQKGRNAYVKQADKTFSKVELDGAAGLSDGNVESSSEGGGLTDRTFVPPFFPFGYERWAGPSFANSPPPSSLPLPKFPFQKAASFPASVFDVAGGELHQDCQSPPPSPVRLSDTIRSSRSDNHDARSNSELIEGCTIASAIGELHKKLNLDDSHGEEDEVAKRLDMEDSAVEMVLGDESVAATRELRKILQLP